MDTQKTLETWLAQEQELRALIAQGHGPGVPNPQWIAQRSGLELIQAMMRGEVQSPSMGATLNFALIEAEPGRAVFQGMPADGHLNPMGTVHGGWYASMLDSAVGCAVHTLLPVGRGYTTAELSVNLVRAIPRDKVQRVRAEGKALHCGRQLATAEGRLYGPDGTLYAHATTTCLVFELPSARQA